VIAPATGKAFAVLFQDLQRWDVGFFRQISWKWPGKIIKPIGSAIEQVVREVPRGEYQRGLAIIDKISFGGELQSIELQDSSSYKGRLFYAHAGELIYSKIRLKQGSVTVIPKEFQQLAVSAEYPVYQVNAEMVLSEYLLLVLRSRAFQNLLMGLSHGGSTKTRIHPREFERLAIPFPDIDIQRAIVAFWKKAEAAVDDARERLSEPVNALNKRLLGLYGKKASSDVIHSRFFALDFKDLAAWDVKSGRASAFRLACPSFRPMGEFIEEATEPVRPFDQPEKDWPLYGVNNKEGVFLNSHQKGAEFNAAYKRIRKDWFFHNPTRCNVGSLGIVPEVPEDAITSPEYQVWRVRDGLRDPMLPDFVAVLIQTPFFLDLVQFNRVGAVKQRMYTENLMQVRIPYLRPDEQRRYSDARAAALADLAKAKARLEVARREVEEMILGTRKVQT